MNDSFVPIVRLTTNLITAEEACPTLPVFTSLSESSLFCFAHNPHSPLPFLTYELSSCVDTGGVNPDLGFCGGSLTEESDSRSSLLWPPRQMQPLCLHPYCTQTSAPAITYELVSCNDLFRPPLTPQNTNIILSPSYRLFCYIKMFCIQIQRASQTDAGIPAGLVYSTVTEFRRPDNSIFQKSNAPSQSFQQEVRQCDDTEKHKQVHAEEHPATAIQPVSQRTLSPQRAVPEESVQSTIK